MRPGPPMSDLNRYLVPALYEGGWSLREIGDCSGVSYQAIQQTLIKLGISRRSRTSRQVTRTIREGGAPR